MTRAGREAYTEREEGVSGGRRAMEGLPVGWASRVERPDGEAGPKGFLVAHASCRSMDLTGRACPVSNAGRNSVEVRPAAGLQRAP